MDKSQRKSMKVNISSMNPLHQSSPIAEGMSNEEDNWRTLQAKANNRRKPLI